MECELHHPCRGLTQPFPPAVQSQIQGAAHWNPKLVAPLEPPTAAARQELLDARWALADPHGLFELEAHALSR